MKNQVKLTLKEILDRQIALDTIIQDLEYEQSVLTSAMNNFLKKNKIYCPMELLSNYKGRSVISIELIDRQGNIYEYSSGEIMNITEDGHFYYSDYDTGIIEYDKSAKKYVCHYHFISSTRNFVGFRNLTLGSKWDLETLEKVKESSTETLIESYLGDSIKIGDIRRKEPKLEDMYI